MTTQGVRVRLDETASASDVGALRKWLERERPLEERIAKGALRIEERPGTPEHGTPMGVGTDILLVLVTVGAEEGVKELLAQTRRAVRAWQDNRRSVESGDPPAYHVDTADPGER